MQLAKKIYQALYNVSHRMVHPHSTWENLPSDYYKDGFMAGEHFVKSQEWIVDYLAKIASSMDRPLKVLDAGSGNGRLYNMLHNKANVDYQAIDITKNLVEASRGLYPQAKFDLMSIEELTFPDKSFDIVIVQHVLRHLTGFEKALQQCFRVGRNEIIVAEKDFSHSEPFQTDYYSEMANSYFYINHYAVKDLEAFAKKHGYRFEMLNDARQNPELQYLVRFVALETN